MTITDELKAFTKSCLPVYREYYPEVLDEIKGMRQVKAKGSKIETMLQKELWQRGIRYRKNVKAIIGKPDIAFLGKKVAVFCDSEFWHVYATGTYPETK